MAFNETCLPLVKILLEQETLIGTVRINDK